VARPSRHDPLGLSTKLVGGIRHDDGNAGVPELQIHVVALLTQPGCYIQVTTTLSNQIAALWQASNTMIADIVPVTSPENEDATRRVILAIAKGARFVTTTGRMAMRHRHSPNSLPQSGDRT
jgi:hypothetical protein